jgi:uncharacterized protein YcbX
MQHPPGALARVTHASDVSPVTGLAGEEADEMATLTVSRTGVVDALWRYPVKSMTGEELEASEVTARGLLGDRAYAVIDRSDGKAASAKNPRKWPRLAACRAAFTESVHGAMPLPPVRIALPDGAAVMSDQADVDAILSRAFGREVRLRAAGEGSFEAENYWPDMEGLRRRDTVTEFALAEETFFDSAVLHILTTASLARLGELYPEGRFDVRRFRPNIVVRLATDERDFVEDAWVGRTLLLGDGVRLRVTERCKRCGMTTLPQADLPDDLGILRTAARHHEASVGVYAAVIRGGTIRRRDPLSLE